MKLLCLISACGLLAAPTLAAAQNEAAPTAAAPAAASQPAATQNGAVTAGGKQKRVCKPLQHTGSRLGSTSVCKTEKEWDDLAAQYRKTLERQQLNPSKVVAQ